LLLSQQNRRSRRLDYYTLSRSPDHLLLSSSFHRFGSTQFYRQNIFTTTYMIQRRSKQPLASASIPKELLDDLADMVHNGYIGAITRLRFNYIMLDTLEVKEMKQFVIDEYWQTFVFDVYIYFTMIGICPYTFIDETVEIEGKKYIFKVPRALEMGSFGINVTQDHTLHKSYEIILNGQSKSKKVHVILSSSRKGFNPHKPDRVDSECGQILNDWRSLQAQIKMRNKHAELVIMPTIWIQKATPVQSQANTEERRTFEELSRAKVDMNGYIIDEVELEKGDGFIKLPPQHQMCPFQPTPELLFDNLDKSQTTFEKLVDLAFMMPSRYSVHENTGGKPTAMEVEEERSKLGSILGQITNDLRNAIRMAWFDLCGESGVSVKLQHKPLTDIPTLISLHENKFISTDLAKAEMLRIAGLKESSSVVEEVKRLKKEDEKE